MSKFDDWFKKVALPSDSYDAMRFAWESALSQQVNSVTNDRITTLRADLDEKYLDEIIKRFEYVKLAGFSNQTGAQIILNDVPTLIKAINKAFEVNK